MLYRHYSDFKGDWRWRHFSAAELSCNHCGEYFHDEKTLDALQKVRETVARPVVVNSGHRCVTHNKAVGGAAASEHLKIAIDIKARGHDRQALLKACQDAGFQGIGFYKTFLHVDMGAARTWGDRGLWR